MKLIKGAALALVLAMALCPTAYAATARGIATPEDSAYHAAHLLAHVGTTDCRVTANNLRVRTDDGETILGHVEQADLFTLVRIEDGRAYIQVLRADASSPDSWAGLTGWVSTDYIDCPCDDDAYHGAAAPAAAAASSANAMAAYAVVLDWYYARCSGEIAEDAVIEHGFESHYCPSSLDEDGFFIRDLDGNGSSELVVMSRTGLSGADDLPVYAVYTLACGHPIRLFLSWTRNRSFLRCDGSFYNEGSNGASYSIYGLHRVTGDHLSYAYVLSDVAEVNGEYVEIWHYTVDNDFDFSNDQTIPVEEAQQLIAQFGSCLVTDPEGFISFGEYGAITGK